jgi:hypothetical protein
LELKKIRQACNKQLLLSWIVFLLKSLHYFIGLVHSSISLLWGLNSERGKCGFFWKLKIIFFSSKKFPLNAWRNPLEPLRVFYDVIKKPCSVQLSSPSQVILKSQHQKTSRPYPVRRHQTGYVYRILFYEKENCRKVYPLLDTIWTYSFLSVVLQLRCGKVSVSNETYTNLFRF